MNNILRKELENNCTKAVIFDIDGTLTEAKFGKKDAISIPWDNCIPEHYHAYIYNDADKLVPIPIMQQIVANISKPLYTISDTHDSIEDRFKDNILNKYYPSIPKESRYYTRNIDEKIEILKCIKDDTCNSHYGSSQIIYIDDSLNSLATIKQTFINNNCGDSILCYHISSFFV